MLYTATLPRPFAQEPCSIYDLATAMYLPYGTIDTHQATLCAERTALPARKWTPGNL